MSFNTAINQIASLLTQGGTPAAHSQDIAARLVNALEGYYDFRESQKGNSAVTDSSSDSSAFRRAFSPPESNPGGIAGADGSDGLGAYAWAVGKDGKDGVDGDGTTLNDYRRYETFNVGGGGGGGLDIRSVNCMDLKAKLKSCGIETGGDCDCSQNLECPPGSGIVRGQNICNVLDDHARQLKKIRERLDKIEKMLEEAVDCP
jgi:hypothetical protein